MYSCARTVNLWRRVVVSVVRSYCLGHVSSFRCLLGNSLQYKIKGVIFLPIHPSLPRYDPSHSGCACGVFLSVGRQSWAELLIAVSSMWAIWAPGAWSVQVIHTFWVGALADFSDWLLFFCDICMYWFGYLPQPFLVCGCRTLLWHWSTIFVCWERHPLIFFLLCHSCSQCLRH